MPTFIPQEFAPPPRQVSAVVRTVAVVGSVFIAGVGVVAYLHSRARSKFERNHSVKVPITTEGARLIGDRMNVDWSRLPIEQFRKGLEVEQEHWQTVGGNMEKIAEIAIAHITGQYGLDTREKGGLSDYYDRLDAMEKQSEAGI